MNDAAWEDMRGGKTTSLNRNWSNIPGKSARRQKKRRGRRYSCAIASPSLHGIVLMIAVIWSFYYGIRRSRRESVRLTAEGR